MGIVQFALRYPHTFYVLAILIVFPGVTAIVVGRSERNSGGLSPVGRRTG